MRQCTADGETPRQGEGTWKVTAHVPFIELWLVLLIVGEKSQDVNIHAVIWKSVSPLKACESKV